jgi:fructosamine-3-kinase
VGSSSDWLSRFRSAVGRPDAIDSLTAGAWRVVLDGRCLVAKVGPGVGDEARGLRLLAAVPGAPPVPEVVLVEADLLVTTWVDQGRRGGSHEEGLGRALAALHASPWDRWGSGSAWIGRCQVAPGESPSAAAFYGARLSDLARRCGLAEVVDPLVARLDQLLPPGGPSLVHGDLWWGNVLWGADGRAWLIDPSVHGGHGEEDLAMLALFGSLPECLVHAYDEVNQLAEGWEGRIELWQLYPLLVHAVLFGSQYRSRAASIARRFA